MNSPVYNSVFKKEFHDLIELKRALGFAYVSEAKAFRRIDSFFINNNLNSKCVTKEICESWYCKKSHESITNQASRISIMRVFCRYLNTIGLPAYVPPKGLTRKAPRYNAHIYTDNELKRFFSAVDESQSVPSECPYRSDVMPVFFRILYTSGMRVSELRLAKLSDVNLDEGYITVYEAKNHKERIIPIHPLLVDRCLLLKEKIHATSPEDEYFFMIRPTKPMTLANVYKNFRRYLEKAGISHTGHGPRVHDFRHTYCVNLLRKWTDEGKDLIAYLPYMRTMLGHEGFEETAYYLKHTSERFPYIKDQLKQSFPDLIQEAIIDEEHEFY
jgi:integrase